MTDHDILRLMGHRIRKARVKANMTQECLAELVGIHWKTIGCIEQGRYPFAVTTFARLARQLETSPNLLLEGLAEPDPQKSEQVKKALARKRKPSPRPHQSTKRH